MALLQKRDFLEDDNKSLTKVVKEERIAGRRKTLDDNSDIEPLISI